MDDNNLRDKISKDIEDKERQYYRNSSDDESGPDNRDRTENQNADRQNSWRRWEIGRTNLEDIANFCRELAIMLEVGIPLLASLELITRRTRKPGLKKVLEDVVSKVSEGTPLSKACESHTDVFPLLFINIVRVGEAGGMLDYSLKRLEEIFMQRLSIRRKVRGAMLYPVIALFMALLVLMVVFVMVVPQFEALYEANDVALPAITSLTISVGNFLESWWHGVLLLIAGLIIALRFASKNILFKRLMDKIRLNIPFIGKVYRDVIIAQLSRTFESLMKSGIPLLDSLKILRETASNYFYGKEFHRVSMNVEKGGKMGQVLDKSVLFPPVMVDMLSVGEETGSIETVLTKLSTYYEDKVDNQLSALSSIIEPLLIIVIGGIVLFVAVSFLLPYWNLVNVIGQ